MVVHTIILALGSRQEDHKSKVSLGYTMSLRPSDYIMRPCLKHNTMQHSTAENLDCLVHHSLAYGLR